MRTDGPVSISLFSGCGGLDLGIEAAGWRTLVQIEMNRDCAYSLRSVWSKRRHRPTVIQAPIEDISPRVLRRGLGLAPQQLDLLVGGPPCQPFTTHGLRKGIRDARARSSFPRYLAFVKEFRPRAIVLENVDGLLSAALKHRPLAQRGPGYPEVKSHEKKGSFLKWMLEKFARLGYCVTWGVLEAADFGVPQMRQRAFLIGVRGSDPVYLPQPTHGANGSAYLTLSDALLEVNDPGPVQPLSDAKKRVFAMIPPGGNWRDLPRHVQARTMGKAFLATGGKSGWWRRLSWSAPSPTVLGMPDHASTALVHPNDVRCLGLFECAALQTFGAPESLCGSSRSRYQQVGNAVPPKLAAAVGRCLADALDGRRQKPPPPPAWRKASSNRRIGTHGWVRPSRTGCYFSTLVKVREDHIWHGVPREEPLFVAG